MKQTLHYTDEKSDKFWRIETGGCALVVNRGRTGTAGRYEIKEFSTEEECEKQAVKLAASKRKKGYTDMPDFDAMHHFYFDTDEYGLHPLTSHPAFRTFFPTICTMTAEMRKRPLAATKETIRCIF